MLILYKSLYNKILLLTVKLKINTKGKLNRINIFFYSIFRYHILQAVSNKTNYSCSILSFLGQKRGNIALNCARLIKLENKSNLMKYLNLLRPNLFFSLYKIILKCQQYNTVTNINVYLLN